ncbi:Stk1 family PASTA domain-containing Ser/Thr kinase [Abyssisolibacter fermentans]|uniref:Stk1 family PASTA domain-containing Ser/Thr kinase n=1 Tax=Abyssisolibacter fermentans TaxID=1766203 RepID=UPI000836A00F|nr:Stk1 family PASTA domain-containing Ser/Thr kinase [Abyssisolibacter fermentans]
MIGKTLGNRYEIIERIGGGGMAIVYKAKCRLLHRYVAVKVLREEFTNNEDFINRFNRESQAAASLSHSNIVGIYDVGAEDNIHYIVMEYVKGKTLKQLIKEKNKLKPKEVIDISLQIAEALNNAHKNKIVHRDIKPHNIMIDDDGKIKVTDFGIARAATTSTVTVTSNVIGSVHYFSPEQARGGYTDAKSDLYSLGIVMYEMLTGKVPFQGDSPISVALKHIQEDITPLCEIDDSIPKTLEKIVTKAVQKDQALRYDNAEEIIDDLQKAKNNLKEDTIEFKCYDDSPTMVIPKEEVMMKKDNETKEIVVPTSRRRNPKAKKINKKQKENNKSSKVLVTIVAIILAFVVTCGLAIGYLYVKDYLVKEEIPIPYVIGLDVDSARKQVNALGLELVVKNEVFNDDYSKGQIVYQTEKAGNTLKSGFPLEVTVSKGSELIEVPDLLNKLSNEAEAVLNNKGLEEGVITHDFSDLPTGIVISQSPKAFQMVKKGTRVNYTISNGPKVNYLIMSNYIGKDINAAKKDLISNGFALGEVKYEKNNDVSKNIVIHQSHPAGQEVEENVVVDFIVSNGSEPTEDSGTETGTNNDTITDTDKDSNTSTDTKKETLNIQLPEDRDTVDVKIYKIQNEQKEVIYEKTVNTSQGGIKIEVTGEGFTKFEIYFDGVYIDDVEYTF